MTGVNGVAWNGHDRRASPRFEVNMLVQDPTGNYEKCDGFLGIAGCYCMMREPPAVGRLIEVQLELLGADREVAARGRVVDTISRESHIGVIVRFENLPFETERMIARWLDQLAGTFPGTSMV
jgi:hypothetical protein